MWATPQFRAASETASSQSADADTLLCPAQTAEKQNKLATATAAGCHRSATVSHARTQVQTCRKRQHWWRAEAESQLCAQIKRENARWNKSYNLNKKGKCR